MALTVNSNFPPPVTTYFCTQTVNIAVKFDWKFVELCKSVENKREAQTLISVMRLYAGTSPEL